MSTTGAYLWPKLVRWALIAQLVLVPRLGLAQQRAAAELLFEEGRQAMTAGDYEEACAKFEESNRLDRAPGTTLNLANCEERRGRVASAWERYRGAIELLAEGDRRRTFAQEKVDALEPRVPRLRIELADDAPAGTVVKRNGEPLTGSFGLSLPLDPGKYTISVQAPGYQAADYRIALKEGEEKSFTVAPGDAVPESEGGEGTPNIIMREDGSTERTLAYVFGGLGLASVVGGGVFGLLAYSNKKTIAEDCPTRFCFTEEGPQAAREGTRNALLANVLVSAGVASLGVGAYFLFTAPDEAPTVLEAGQFHDLTGLRLRGTF